MPEGRENWEPLLSRWTRYVDCCANNVVAESDSASALAWTWDADSEGPVTALDALAANVALTRLLDAERDEQMIAALADFGGWQPALQAPGGRPNSLGVLEEWDSWAALAAVWSDHLERRASIAAAEYAEACGDAAGADRHHSAAQLIEPLSPVDALAIAVYMIKSLDMAKGEVIRAAIAEGATDQQIADIVTSRAV